MNGYKEAGSKIREIEDELKRLGRWQAQPLEKERFENMGPFGMNTMVFEQWLQFVLVPRVHEIIDKKGAFPKKSEIAPVAVKNLDGDPDAVRLIQLLSEFDEIVNGG